MGNFGRTSKNVGVKGVSTAFWAVVLLGSTCSIGAGFVGGRTVVAAGALPAPVRVELPPPQPIRTAALVRTLSGAHSLEGADDVDPYGDPTLGVAEHPWPAGSFDPRTQRAKIAILVADASRAGRELDAFAASPLPFALVVTPADDGAAHATAVAHSAGKAVLIDASSARPSDVAALGAGAQGVFASLDRRQARDLLRVVDPNAVLIDSALRENDDLAAVARASSRRVLWRDVIADARDDAHYVDFMLRDALAIAQRHGSAIVIVHARAETLAAVEHFADRAHRDGADLVPLTEL